MKKLITMIGIGAALCLAPSCKKSGTRPILDTKVNAVAERALPQQQPPAADINTSLYVMLASKPCLAPEKEYTSLMVDIVGVQVYSEKLGWRELNTFDADWDLVSMQHGTGINISDRMEIDPGTITKVAVRFGENSTLDVNNQRACFKLASQEVVIDLKGEIVKGSVNELKLAMDMCGHIGVHVDNEGTKCYILKPVVDFVSLTQKLIK
jgi:hypothetical protein